MATATQTAQRPRLKERYDEELRARLKDELGLSSVMRVPRLAKITLNMGVGVAKVETKGAANGRRPASRWQFRQARSLPA